MLDQLSHPRAPNVILLIATYTFLVRIKREGRREGGRGEEEQGGREEEREGQEKREEEEEDKRKKRRDLRNGYHCINARREAAFLIGSSCQEVAGTSNPHVCLPVLCSWSLSERSAIKKIGTSSSKHTRLYF